MYQYNVYTLTTEQLASLISAGDDSKRNQIRIKEDGTVFLSTIVGNKCLDGIAGRFETFDAGNGYVGQDAACKQEYIERLYHAIQNWTQNPKSYVDTW